jgi:hypothetical protein
MECFDRLEVEQLIHCGDVGGEAVFDELVGRPLHFVWGNTDDCDRSFESYLRAMGFSVPTEVPTRLTLASKKIAIFHGHEPGFAAAPRTLSIDYLFHGHTHIASDNMHNGTRVINPGALYRSRRPTVATLDLVTDELLFHEIPK